VENPAKTPNKKKTSREEEELTEIEKVF